jgi:serine/threonine protein phosphatase PrpC
MFKIDKEFLDSGTPSGSTATMCIVHAPDGPTGERQLRVINAGDSRTLLGRRDGSIVDGGGTDQGLTTDHKPDHPVETERIVRCGGKVERGLGGARVNGDLAVSRGFGDQDHKRTRDPRTGTPCFNDTPEDRPVTVAPECGRFECSQSDFLLLVCDGVSEGNFSNPEVCELVAQVLKATDDPLEAAKAVCHKAVECQSKDNVTCMVVLFDGQDPAQGPDVHFVPGRVYMKSKGFITAYQAMAEKAGLTLAQALAKRWDLMQAGSPTDAEERSLFGDVPTAPIQRQKWFETLENSWLANDEARGNAMDDDDGMSGFLQSVMANPNQREMLANLLGGRGGGVDPNPVDQHGRKVRAVPQLSVLKQAVDMTPALTWDDRMGKLPGREGQVLRDDPSDNTTEVIFRNIEGENSMRVWLPRDTLEDLGDD